MKLPFLFLSILGAASWAQGIHASPKLAPQAISQSSALEEWAQDYPGPWILRRSEWSNQPRLLFGGYIPGGDSSLGDEALIERASQVMSDAAGVMGYGVESLAFTKLNRHENLSGKAIVTVGFSQEFDGIPVESGKVAVLMREDGGVSAILTAAIPAKYSPPTVPQISAEQAQSFSEQAFLREYGGLPEQVLDSKMRILGIHSGELGTPALAWMFDLKRKLKGGGVQAHRYWVQVDQDSPKMVANHSLIKNCGPHGSTEPKRFPITGQLSAAATQDTLPGNVGGNLPDNLGGNFTAGSWPAQGALPSARVELGAGGPIVYADDLGSFFESNVSGQVDATVSLVSRLVHSQTSADVFTTVRVPFSSLTVPYAETESGFQSGTIYLNTTQGDEDATAACNAFYAAQKFRDFAKGDLGNAELDDYPLDLYVSKGFSPPYFNPGDAYQLGNEVHFAKSDLSTGFANMAYSTVLAHELGHWANSKYGFTGTLGAGDGVDEAIADAWAMYIYDSNFIAENYNGVGTFVRDGNNLSQKCEGSSGCYGDAHLNGEPLMGALWDVRERVGAAHLGAGVLYPNALFRRIVTDSSIVFFGMEDAIRDIWLVYDDLMNPPGGFGDPLITPFFPQINSSFVDHGWPEFGLNAITVNHVPPVDSPQNQPSFTIAAEIELDPNFTQSAFGNSGSLVVQWTLDGVTQPSVSMIPTSDTEFEAVLVPSGGGGFVGGNVIEYFLQPLCANISETLSPNQLL